MAQTTKELLDARFGVETQDRDNPIVTQIEDADTLFLRANPNRLAFILYNLSANSLFVNPEGIPSSTNGFRVAPNGGFISFVYDEDFMLPTREWRGIAGAAGSVILVTEITTR